MKKGMGIQVVSPCPVWDPWLRLGRRLHYRPGPLEVSVAPRCLLPERGEVLNTLRVGERPGTWRVGGVQPEV